MEIDAGRLAEILAQRRPETPFCDPRKDFSHHIAPGRWVVSMRRARLPHGRRICERGGQRGWVQPEFGVDRIGKARQTGLVRHQLADRDVLLSCRGEVRPDSADRCVIAIFKCADDACEDERADALGRRIDGDERFFAPRRLLSAIGIAAAKVDNHFTVQDDRKPGP